MATTDQPIYVSTHSRPKAAGNVHQFHNDFLYGFNTQPPEGGWNVKIPLPTNSYCFNTQPPEGGWPSKIRQQSNVFFVSTHSRPKAAGTLCFIDYAFCNGFNTQPPEGGWLPVLL